MDANKKIVTRTVQLDDGYNLLEILTGLPKNVAYPDLILKTCVENHDGRDFAEVWLEYQSLETDEEFETRVRLEKIRAKHDEDRERNQLRYLYEKYGKPE